MAKRECVGCGHPVYPDERVDFGSFVLCVACETEIFAAELHEHEDEVWARLNAEQSLEDKKEDES